MKEQFLKYKDEFINAIIEDTLDVDLEIPKNVVGDFSSLLK